MSNYHNTEGVLSTNLQTLKVMEVSEDTRIEIKKCSNHGYELWINEKLVLLPKGVSIVVE